MAKLFKENRFCPDFILLFPVFISCIFLRNRVKIKGRKGFSTFISRNFRFQKIIKENFSWMAGGAMGWYSDHLSPQW